MKQHPVLVLTMFALLVASPSGGTRAAPAPATGASVAAVSGSRSLDLRLPAGLATSPTQVQAPAQSDPQSGSANATPAPLAARTSVGAGGAAAGGDPGVEDDEAREADGVATLRAGGLLARFGPQKLAYTSLIHADLDRNGAVAQWGAGDDLRVRGFGVSADAVQGFGHLLGADRADYRINGVIVERDLALAGVDRARVLGGWVTGAAKADGAHQRSGDAWSLACDAEMVERRARVHVEYAGSELDPQRAATDSAAHAKAGQAYRTRFELHAAPSDPHPWVLGSEFSSVSAQFGSLANPALATDRVGAKTFATIDFGELSLDLRWDTRRDNPAADPGRAATRSNSTRVAATWSPTFSVVPAYIGHPSYKLAAAVGDTRDRRTDAAVAHPPVRTMSVSLQTEFAHPGWLWGVRTKGARAPGALDAPVAAGLETVALDLYGDMHGADELPLKPVVSWQRRRDLGTGTTSRRLRTTLVTSPYALAEDLSADFDLGYQRRIRSDGAIDEHAARLAGKLRWTVDRPTRANSGVAVEVSGRLVVGGDAGAGFADDVQFMVSLSTLGVDGR